MERRFTSNSQNNSTAVRSSKSDGKLLISGYASVFWNGQPSTEYQLWPGVKERILPTAFDAAIRDRHDVRGLLNHDSNFILGRTASGTLKLSVDKIGLRYEIELPPTRQDVYESVRRGDLSSSSFAFLVTDENWRKENRQEIREIRSVQLSDVSVVAYPAYSAATVNVSAARSAFRDLAAKDRRMRFLQLAQQQGA